MEAELFLGDIRAFLSDSSFESARGNGVRSKGTETVTSTWSRPFILDWKLIRLIMLDFLRDFRGNCVYF